MPNYLSNSKPDFKPYTVDCGEIKAFQYKKPLSKELAAKSFSKKQAIDLLEDMMIVREFEEMIIKVRSVSYESCVGFEYRGPTHVSIGQEATAVGACVGIAADDQITTTHRGHGDSIAKGCVAIRAMSTAQLKERVPKCKAK